MDSNSTYTDGARPLPPNGIGALTFTPILSANAVFLTIFVILLLAQVLATVKFWRNYGYAIGMVGGLLLEMVGYVAKVQLSQNRRNKNAYIMYIIGLTLGPTFLSASLYLGISALQRQIPEARFKRIGPRLFSSLFILGDFACLCFIGCGGSLAAIYAWSPIGVDLMIAGLATQVLCTATFCVVLFMIYRKIYFLIYKDRMRWYMTGAALSAACLFIRSSWRVAELSDGFNGSLASKEGIFIALDSIPMILMSLLITLLHPGYWFQRRDRRAAKLLPSYEISSFS